MKFRYSFSFLILVMPLLEVWPVDRLDNLENWGIYRGDYRGTQFSEISQINAANVHRLEPVWEYNTGDSGERTSSYANPIMVDGIIYVSTPSLNCAAIDASTGEEVWFFDSSRYNEGGKRITGRNRGVVYWEGGAQPRVFVFVRDRVYAVEAETGRLITSFGENGHIDLRKNLGIDPSEASIEVTTPGIVYGDLLIMGSRVPEGYNSTPGHIRAFNAITGEFVWIFHTIPQPGEFGYDTWEFVEGEKYGGANPWGGFTLDPERGWVFCATGSPNSDFYGGFRKGQNLFGNCVLALDARTGERIWHYQTVHHDLWDMDNPSAPVLVTFEVDGKEKDAVVQFTKMGFTFVLDRETGEPLFPTPELPVPPSDVPGEEAWPTQPIPLKPPPLGRTMVTDSELSRITPEAYEHVRKIFDQYNKSPIYTPPSLRGELQAPGFLGGTQWHGGSFDPYLDVIYVNSHEGPGIVKLRESREPVSNGEISSLQKGASIYQRNCVSCHGTDLNGIPPIYPSLVDSNLSEAETNEIILQGKGLMAGFPHLSKQDLQALNDYINNPEDHEEASDSGQGVTRYYFDGFTRLRGPDGEPGLRPPWGTLNAIDLSRGEFLWRVPLGEYPALVAKGIRNTGAMNYGGVVATTGGVIFVGATPDEKIRAFDKHNGDLLWEYKLPAGAYSTPSTFMLEGRQYLVVTACGGGKNGTPPGDSIIAFALGEPEKSHPQYDPSKNKLRVHRTDMIGPDSFDHVQARAEAKIVFPELARAQGWEFTQSSDTRIFTDEGLADIDVIILDNNSGIIFDEEQKKAFQRWVAKGGGVVGIHGATHAHKQVSEKNVAEWPFWYGLWGVLHKSGPKPGPSGRRGYSDWIIMEDTSGHWTRALPRGWVLDKVEWYFWNYHPNYTGKNVIATADVQENQPLQPEYYPVTWCDEYEGGRVWYTNMGHYAENYRQPEFIQHIIDGIDWVAGLSHPSD